MIRAASSNKTKRLESRR